MRYIKPIVWLIFIFSGASSLIYEVIWMRQLTLIFGSTVFRDEYRPDSVYGRTRTRQLLLR